MEAEVDKKSSQAPAKDNLKSEEKTLTIISHVKPLPDGKHVVEVGTTHKDMPANLLLPPNPLKAQRKDEKFEEEEEEVGHGEEGSELDPEEGCEHDSEEEGCDLEYECEFEGEEEGDDTGHETRPRCQTYRVSTSNEEEGEGSISPTSTPRDSAEDEQGEDEEGQSDSESPDEEEALRNENIKSTLIEKECVVPEVLLVWEHICKFIIEKMLEGFGVRIPGLGTFSHVVLPNDIMKKPESGKFLLRKTRKFPVFKICSHLKQAYRLIEDNQLYQCNAPTVPLNVSVIASNVKLGQGIVEGIIIETLQSFVTGIITNKSLEFPFPFIGKVYIKKRKVFMIFYQHFCEGLSFNFENAPPHCPAVFPGNMTPLPYHRPAQDFHSVFHFSDMRSVEEKVTATARHFSKGVLAQNDSAMAISEYEFAKSLFTRSTLPYHCSCDDQPAKKEDPASDSTVHKPDGSSSYSPEPLYKSAKTGHPILDSLADDACLLQQAIGCWMKKHVVQTLGEEAIMKHHDRDYFRQQENSLNSREKAYTGKRSLFSNGKSSAASLSASQKMMDLSRLSMEEEEEDVQEQEENFDAEEDVPLGEVELDLQNQGTSCNEKKVVQTRFLRLSKDAPLPEQEGYVGEGEESIFGEVELGLQNDRTSCNEKNTQNSKDVSQLEEGEGLEEEEEKKLKKGKKGKPVRMKSFQESKDEEEEDGQVVKQQGKRNSSKQQKRRSSESQKKNNPTSISYEEFGLNE